MNDFQTDKKAKLRSSKMLYVYNILGAVSWSEDEDGYGAVEKLRLIHPLTLIVIVAVFIVSTLLRGIIETWPDARRALKEETVWW